MKYFYVDAAGPHAADFATIKADLQQLWDGIFGADEYIAPDSQDGQLIAALAVKFNELVGECLQTYNSFSPATAIGNALSSRVKINGLRRKVASNSTATVTIGGQVGVTITNGQVIDTNNVTWALPTTVTIPAAGQIDVTATAADKGAIQAAPGSINRIKTAVYGWQTVTNAAAATPGQPVEEDAALRVRQSQSVALPSQTIFDGMLAEVRQVTGVTRAQGYENANNGADSNGIAGRSVALIVEGGNNVDIFNAIALHIPPGTPTVGAVTTTYTSPKGSTRPLAFSRPTAANIYVELTLTHLSGWDSATQALIAKAVADYINGLPIGKAVEFFKLAVPASLPGSVFASTFSLTGMRIKKNVGGVFSNADIALAYNEAPIGLTANVSFV